MVEMMDENFINDPIERSRQRSGFVRMDWYIIEFQGPGKYPNEKAYVCPVCGSLVYKDKQDKQFDQHVEWHVDLAMATARKRRES